MAPDIEYSEDPAWPGAGTYRGAESCRRVWDEYYEQFGEQVFEPEELLDIDDRVVIILRWSARGTSSGAALNMRQGHLHTLRDGRLIRWQVYFDPEEAVAAAGLSRSQKSR
jgi:ketosteroid isomerase-like protein